MGGHQIATLPRIATMFNQIFLTLYILSSVWHKFHEWAPNR